MLANRIGQALAEYPSYSRPHDLIAALQGVEQRWSSTSTDMIMTPSNLRPVFGVVLLLHSCTSFESV